MVDSFDEFDSYDQQLTSADPIWTIPLSNEDKLLKWLNAELKFLERENEDRLREIKHNLARYKGIQYQTLDTRSGNRDREQERAKFSPKLVKNYLAYTTEQRVARLVKFKPEVAILPQHDEHQDKVSAKIAKAFLDHIKHVNRYEMKNLMAIRVAEICGEGYIEICWDADAGAIHPQWKDGEKIPLVGDNGQPLKDDDGKPVMIEDPVHVGEVKYKCWTPLHLLFEKCDEFDDAKYFFSMEKMKVAELRQEFPDKASKIKAETAKSFYNVSKMEDEKLVNEVIKFTFWHKRTKQVPNGYKIVFTKDAILKADSNPYDHGEFPIERMVCKMVPGEQHAVSYYRDVKGLQAQLNNLGNAIIRSQQLMGHAKWFVPRGSVKVEALGNDHTIVQYQGGQPPILAQANPTGAEIFNHASTLKQELLELSLIGDVIRGEPPKGLSSGVALQFVAEQEQQVANAQIVYYNEFVRRVAEKTLKTAAQYYDPSDERTILVLGKNKQWVAQNFDPKHLARPYDVRIQNSSALPDSKAARIQLLIDLNQQFPGAFPQERVMEMLDFGLSDQFLTDGAAAARSAELENERMIKGEEVKEPAPHENHAVHWATHFQAMQDYSFKELPEDIQQRAKDHLMATEYLIYEKAKNNPMLLQQMSANPNFPALYTPPEPTMLPPMPMGGEMPAGAMAGPMDAMAPMQSQGEPMSPEAAAMIGGEEMPAIPNNPEVIQPI